MCIYECENVLQIAQTHSQLTSIIPSKVTILSIGLIQANTGNHGIHFFFK